MLQIPNNKYSTDLCCFLYPERFDNKEDKNAAILLHKICSARLINLQQTDSIENLRLSNEEKEVVIQNKWRESDNIEIRSRCLDLLRHYENDKRKTTQESSDGYLEVYNKTKEVEYIIRSATVRNIKILNDEKFLNTVTSYIQELYPYWINQLIIALLKSYSTEQLSFLVSVIESKKQQLTEKHDFHNERECIKILHNIKSINQKEFTLQLALCYEKEGDEMVKNKKPNTFYPNLPDIYRNAYQEIYKLQKEQAEVFKRIKYKLENEQQIFIDALSVCGIKTEFKITDNFKEQIKAISIHNVAELIYLSLTIPFPTKEDVNEYMITCRKASPMVSMFGRTQLNEKGNIVGVADCEKSLRTESHIYYRQYRLYTLWSYFDLLHYSNIEISEDVVFYLLEEHKPEFVDEDCLIFWAKGIAAGLKNDFFVSSHILMPQLEQSLRNMAELNSHGSITSLEKQRQEEPSLGKTLPLLENIIESETLFELKSFLESGIDVNFRNNLLHGLFKPFEVEKYGIYLWWVCLKLFFKK